MIRSANLNDLSAINELGTLVNPSFASTYDIKSYLENNRYFIIIYEIDLKICGLLIVYKNIDYYEIEMIVVANDERRKGIGTNLLNYFEKNYLIKDDIIYLEVAVNNTNAIKLYQKFDYEVINIRKKYYNNKIDAYVMKKVKG